MGRTKTSAADTGAVNESLSKYLRQVRNEEIFSPSPDGIEKEYGQEMEPEEDEEPVKQRAGRKSQKKTATTLTVDPSASSTGDRSSSTTPINDPRQETLREVERNESNRMWSHRVQSMEAEMRELREGMRESMQMQILMMKRLSEQASSPKTPTVSSKPEVFKAPRGHPVFKGNAMELEKFIIDMGLMHSRHIMDGADVKHNPEFISQLGPYFEGDSRDWFRSYANNRLIAKENLTWEHLVKTLRSDYGGNHQAEARFKAFFKTEQTGDINSYIARINTAARLAEDDLTPRTRLYGFLGGLKADVQDHVRLRVPKTIEEAEEYARAYENTMMNSKKRKGGAPEGHGKDNSKTKQDIPPASTGRQSRPILPTPEAQAAFDEIKRLRLGRCVRCGLPGHIVAQCKSDESVVAPFQAKIDALKLTMNGPASRK